MLKGLAFQGGANISVPHELTPYFQFQLQGGANICVPHTSALVPLR